MTSPRQKYRAEYKTLLELQRTIAFRSAGFVSAIAAMNSTELGPATLQEIKNLADEYEMVSEEEKKRLWLKCRNKGCNYTGPVLHFAFIYETTLCPKCASKKVFAKGTASTYSRR